jgi:hypothetical protein
MVKLIMSWNIRQGKESEYVEFLTHDFIRLVMGLGFHPLDAWYSVWGHGPQVIAGGVAKDLKTMEDALASENWKNLQKRLDEYVVDFDYKVVEATRGFQL